MSDFRPYLVPTWLTPSQDDFQNIWKKVRKALELPEWVKYYRASRKSIGSQLRQERVPVSDIAKQLGHTGSKMAEQHYSVLEVETMRADLLKLRGVGSGMVLSLEEAKKQKKGKKEVSRKGTNG